MRKRNVAPGIVLSLLLCVYLCFVFACFVAACFWRNKDAYIDVHCKGPLEPGAVFTELVMSASGTERNRERDWCMCVARGCADVRAPRNGWVQRVGDRVTITCNFSSHTWHLVCRDTHWVGQISSCNDGIITLLLHVLLYGIAPITVTISSRSQTVTNGTCFVERVRISFYLIMIN